MKLEEISIDLYSDYLADDYALKMREHYVQSYNESSDKVQALANLVVNRNGINELIRLLDSELDTIQSNLSFYLNANMQPIVTGPDMQIIEPDNRKELRSNIETVIGKIKRLTQSVTNIGSVQGDDITSIKTKIKSIYNQSGHYFPYQLPSELNNLIESSFLYNSLSVNSIILHELIKEVLKADYSPQLRSSIEFSSSEKSQFRFQSIS